MWSSNHRFSGGKLLVSERLVFQHLGSLYIFSWGAKFTKSSWFVTNPTHFSYKKKHPPWRKSQIPASIFGFFFGSIPWKTFIVYLLATLFLSNKPLQIGFLVVKTNDTLQTSRFPEYPTHILRRCQPWLFQWNFFDFTLSCDEPVCLLLVNIL